MVENKPFLRFCFILLIFSSSDSIFHHATSTKNPSRIVAKLVHRDSVLSPYYTSVTPADRARQGRESSMQRFKYLDAKSRGELWAVNDTRADVLPDQSGLMFMANISIGEPPVPQLLLMDTASRLLTMQCLPCTMCYKQTNPYFDPSKSSTYANLSCTSPPCMLYRPRSTCDPLDNCQYRITYVDGDYMQGVLATEKLTFATSDEGVRTVSNVAVGCGHVNKGYSGNASGILGLSHHELSLTNEVGSMFSYCIGSISDPGYTHSHLVLGDGIEIEGYTTLLEVYDTLYYLALDGISVGEIRLAIDPEVFKRKPSGEGGVIIDSGSTLTYLVREAYDALSAEVLKVINGRLKHITVRRGTTEYLCFRGAIERDLVNFPLVTIHMAFEAKLELDVMRMFEKIADDLFCMSIVPSTSESSLNVIGVRAQQNYNVAYDVPRDRIYFQNTDCALSDE